MKKALCVLTLGISILGDVPSALSVVKDVDTLLPDKEIQQSLRSIALADNSVRFFRAVAEARSIVDQRRLRDEDVVKQVLYHRAYGSPGPSSSRVHELVSTDVAGRAARLVVLLPYLNSKDGRVERAAEELVSTSLAPDTSYGVPPRYSDVSAILGKAADGRQAELPQYAIHIMYLQHPDAALYTFMQAHLPRGEKEKRAKILSQMRQVSEHVWRKGVGLSHERNDDDAIAAIRDLGAESYWWARLYAAAAMRKHPELLLADVVKKLEGDEEAVVSVFIRAPQPVPTTDVSR